MITDVFYWATQRRPVLSKAAHVWPKNRRSWENIYAVNSTRLSSRTTLAGYHFPVSIYPIPWEAWPVKWYVTSKRQWQWWEEEEARKQPGAQVEPALRTREGPCQVRRLSEPPLSPTGWAPIWQSTRKWAWMCLPAWSILEISGIRHSAWHHRHSFKMNHDFYWKKKKKRESR